MTSSDMITGIPRVPGYEILLLAVLETTCNLWFMHVLIPSISSHGKFKKSEVRRFPVSVGPGARVNKVTLRRGFVNKPLSNCERVGCARADAGAVTYAVTVRLTQGSGANVKFFNVCTCMHIPVELEGSESGGSR